MKTRPEFKLIHQFEGNEHIVSMINYRDVVLLATNYRVFRLSNYEFYELNLYEIKDKEDEWKR